MEQPEGSARRCRPRSTPFSDTDGTGRISAFPDDVLLGVLARVLCARTAARASVISRRWRGLWRHLPELHLHGIAPDTLVAALAQFALPKVSVLHISVPKRFKFSAAGVASLLRTAARLAPMDLIITIWGNRNDSHVAVKLPCFDRATSIKLELGDISLKPLAASGEFPVLERLYIAGCILDTAGLIMQCPRLRVLQLRRSRHVDVFRVHSTTIEELVVDGDGWLGGIDMVAPVLKKFTLSSYVDKDFSISLLAPTVRNLSWHCMFMRVGIDGMWCLNGLKLWMKKSGYNLCLDIYIPLQSDDLPYARNMQDIAQFPDISVLELFLGTRGHVFGAVVLNMLGMFTAIQGLKLDIQRYTVEYDPCLPNCHCDQPHNWQSQNISLTALKEVEMKNFEGSSQEVDFLRLMLRCAPLMKRVTVKLSRNVSPYDIEWKEIFSILEANPAVKCHVYDGCGNKWNMGDLVCSYI